MRIAVVAPARPITADDADAVTALARLSHPGVELWFDPQCFAVHGHFAGDDAARLAALVAAANRADIDAIWLARGGYGNCRIAGDAVAAMGPAARRKSWLGYSDAGYLLAALYRDGADHVAHGPMVADHRRDGGAAAVGRALDWLVARDPAAVEGGLMPGQRVAAFNLVTLAMLMGTPLEPDLAGHVVLVEEVGEHLYAVDRALFHVTAALAARGAAGLRLGRVSEVPGNDVDFGITPAAMARHWCGRHGLAWLGAADIGHDGANRVVPFGLHPG